MNKPELFSKFNYMSKAVAVKYLNEYARKLKWRNHGESIIDLGCGDGAVTSIIKRYVPTKDVRFVASDISREMVEYARKHYSKENITFRVLDIAGNLPSDLKHQFNHAISFFALHFVTDQEKAFRNIYELLRDEGDCFLCFIKNAPYFDIYVQASQNNNWKPWITNVNKRVSPYYYDSMENAEQKVTKIMEAVGFKNIEVKCENVKHVMKNGMELKNLMKAVEPFHLPDDVFEDFAKDSIAGLQQLGLLDNTCTRFEDHNKTVDFNCQVIVGYGVKP